MARAPKGEYEESIQRARENMDQDTYRLLERTKETWFLAGCLFAAITLGLVWWVAKSS